MTPLRFVFVALAVTAVSCSGSSARVATTSARSHALPILPMRMLRLHASDDSRPILDLRGDGTILDDRGRPIARFDGARVVGPNGEGPPLLTIDPDGTVRSPVTRDGPLGHFDRQDAFVFSVGEATLRVDDSGVMRGGGRLDARFVPFDPRERRTAEMMMVLFVAAYTGLMHM